MKYNTDVVIIHSSQYQRQTGTNEFLNVAMVRRRRDPTKGAPTHNNWTQPKTLFQGPSPAAPFLLLQVNISSFSSDYVCAVAVIDVPLLIRQLNQRHMTGCAVLLNIIM